MSNNPHRSSAGSGLGISFSSLSPPMVSTTQVSTGFSTMPQASSSSSTASPVRIPQSSTPTRSTHSRGHHERGKSIYQPIDSPSKQSSPSTPSRHVRPGMGAQTPSSSSSHRAASPTTPGQRGRGLYQPTFALRPTHQIATASNKGFASFSALPPSPSSSTPSHSERNHQRTLSNETGKDDTSSSRRPWTPTPRLDYLGQSDEVQRKISSSSNRSTSGKLKRSKSSELLRRLSGKHDTVSGGKYIPLEGEEEEEEEDRDRGSPSRRERSHTVSTVSANPAQTPKQQSLGATPTGIEASFMPSTSFPAPPHRPSTASSSSRGPLPYIPRSTSFPQNPHTGHNQNTVRRMDSSELKRISDPSTGIHSQNFALIEASEGGKYLQYSPNQGVWSADTLRATPQARSLDETHASGETGMMNNNNNNNNGNSNRNTNSDDADLRSRPWSDSTISQQRHHGRSLSEGAILARQGTLLHPSSNYDRQGQELGIMLGNNRRKANASKILPAPDQMAWSSQGGQTEKIKLEVAKKRKAVVEVDVVLERECVVEGGEIRGRMEVRVNGKNGTGMRVGAGKVRVVGYEDISSTSRHIFYHYPHSLPLFAHPAPPNAPRSSLFASSPDSDGFRVAAPGTHWIPFSVRLPLHGGAKGSYSSPSSKGPSVRYVVVGSVKLYFPTTNKRSIAHFYRSIVVLPYLNPGIVLAPSEETVEVIQRNQLGWKLGGAKGEVELRIALGRTTWVSGQRVWCEVGIKNDSNKRIKTLTLALLQTVQTFIPDPHKRPLSLDKDGLPNADEALGIASTARRKVAEEVTEADDIDHQSGRVTGKNWWTGVDAGEMGGWDMSLLVPNGMITIPRTKLVEVTYTLRLTANSSIFVDVPVTLINFLSIDPPPMPGDGARMQVTQPMMVPVGENGLYRGIASTDPHSYPASSEGQHSLAARASSTTLHVDALLAAGRARAEIEAMANYPLEARARPMSMGSEYTPEGHSVKSRLTTPAARSIEEVPHGSGSKPTRPSNNRVMSYLSYGSAASQLSESDGDIEDDEDAKALLAAARREGRKMSLAALTRASEREQREYLPSSLGNDLLSPMRETPPTGSWAPMETPFEEGFKLMGDTPSVRSPIEEKKEEDLYISKMGNMTIEEEQKMLAPSRESMEFDRQEVEKELSLSEGSHNQHDQMGYDDKMLESYSIDENGKYHQYGLLEMGKRSHESIPEEEEPLEDEEDMPEVGNETILENMVGDHENNEGDDTIHATLPPSNHHRLSNGSQLDNPFEYKYQEEELELKSPNPESTNSGTGHTASSLQVPSRKGSALDSQALLSVNSERELHVQQTRSIYGSFAASAISEVESEVGQVVEGVKRNLSIKTPSTTMNLHEYRKNHGDEREEQDADEEYDDVDHLSPTRTKPLNIPRSGSAPYTLGGIRKNSASPRKDKSNTPSPTKDGQMRYGSAPNLKDGLPMRRESSAPSISSPLREKGSLPNPTPRVFANRPAFSFNAPPPLQIRENSLSPRHGPVRGGSPVSPGLSPRSQNPPTLHPETTERLYPSQSSRLRNQIRPASSDGSAEGIPGLAPSVASDSGSSDGHALESPPIHSEPIHQTLTLNTKIFDGLSGGTNLEKGDVRKGSGQELLNPNWAPGEHLLHTQVAFARTSFSAPDSHPDNFKPRGSKDQPPFIGQVRPESPTSPTFSSHSDKSVVITGFQNRMKQLDARDEALRKFSVASAASGQGGRRESDLPPLLPSEQTRRTSGKHPNENYYRSPKLGGPSEVFDAQPPRKEVRKRKSYTAALAPKPQRSSSDDTVERERSMENEYQNNPVGGHSRTGSNYALGGTSFFTKRSFGNSPPDQRTVHGWQSPPKMELSFSPTPVSAPQQEDIYQHQDQLQNNRLHQHLQRNLSINSNSTTATSIEAALIRRPGGPRSHPPLPSHPPLHHSSTDPSHPKGRITMTHSQSSPVLRNDIESIDPYESTSETTHHYEAVPEHNSSQLGTQYLHPSQANRYNQGQRKNDFGSIGRSGNLRTDMEYGADSYGSESGSVSSRRGVDMDWQPPRRNWENRGSHATDSSEGLL